MVIVATRLSALAAEVHTALVAAGITVPQLDDREGLQQHNVRRRIVWLTPGGDIEAPKHASSRVSGSTRTSLCRSRVAQVRAHVFDQDLETCEELVDAVIAAICKVVPDAVFGGYRWPQEAEQSASGRNLRNHECVISFAVRFGVSGEISPLVTLTAQSHTCGTLQDDGSIVPQDEVPP